MIDDRVCDQCSRVFIPRNTKQLRCSKACSIAGRNERQMWKYHNDAEYRQRKMEMNRARYLRMKSPVETRDKKQDIDDWVGRQLLKLRGDDR